MKWSSFCWISCEWSFWRRMRWDSYGGRTDAHHFPSPHLILWPLSWHMLYQEPTMPSSIFILTQHYGSTKILFLDTEEILSPGIFPARNIPYPGNVFCCLPVLVVASFPYNGMNEWHRRIWTCFLPEDVEEDSRHHLLFHPLCPYFSSWSFSS